jgi:hypothetical protein
MPERTCCLKEVWAWPPSSPIDLCSSHGNPEIKVNRGGHASLQKELSGLMGVGDPLADPHSQDRNTHTHLLEGEWLKQ